MAKLVKNVSEEVHNHGLFTGLYPGFTVVVEDAVAAQLVEDFHGKFEVEDYKGGRTMYSIVGSTPVEYHNRDYDKDRNPEDLPKVVAPYNDVEAVQEVASVDVVAEPVTEEAPTRRSRKAE